LALDGVEKIKDVRIAMIAAASKTLDYIQSNKYATVEEVMSHILKEVYAHDDVKRGAIAAANFTYKYKMKHHLLSNKEILREVSNSIGDLLSHMNTVGGRD